MKVGFLDRMFVRSNTLTYPNILRGGLTNKSVDTVFSIIINIQRSLTRALQISARARASTYEDDN